MFNSWSGLCSAITRSRERGRQQIFVMQATQQRSGAHPEALADPMAGESRRGRRPLNGYSLIAGRASLWRRPRPTRAPTTPEEIASALRKHRHSAFPAGVDRSRAPIDIRWSFDVDLMTPEGPPSARRAGPCERAPPALHPPAAENDSPGPRAVHLAELRARPG